MGNPTRHIRGKNRKTIVDTISKIGYRKSRSYQVFSDWVEMLAIAFSNAVDKVRFAERETRYLSIVKNYTKEELNTLAELLPILIDEFSQGDIGVQFDDVLGDIYMNCEFCNEYSGQFFTPYTVSYLMAQILMSDTKSTLEQKGFIDVCEPACGAGGMCIASADALHSMGINYQQCLHMTAQDIDPMCVHMAYIQLTLLHIPAVVILGDSLRLEERQHWFTPAHVLNGWGAKLRHSRITPEVINLLKDVSAEGKTVAEVPLEKMEVGSEHSEESRNAVEQEQFCLF
jgi:hypothetical protein